MQMPTNRKKNDSLRASGAFKAPSILLKKGEVDLTDKYDEQAEYLLGLVDECSHNFMKKYDIDEFDEKLIREYLSMTPQQRASIKDFFKKFFG